MTETANYKFQKPGLDGAANIEVLDSNWDKADAAIKAEADARASADSGQQTRIEALEEAVADRPLKTEVLTKTNAEPYTPSGDYQPATKVYVDDAVAGGGDMSKSVYDTNGSGVVDDAEMLGGQPPSYYATAYAVNGKAPANHANMNTIYGVGTTMSYGHVKITDDFAQDERKHGIALSGYAGYVLDSRLTAVETGTLPVSKGGTGATTASGALANLGIKIQTTIPTSLSNGEIVFVVEG